MQNRHSLNAKHLLFTLLWALPLAPFFHCAPKSDTITQPKSQSLVPPEFFVEKGSDLDSSYISFRGLRKNSDTLEIEATSWGVIEYGLVLCREYAPKAIHFLFIGRCGTVSTRTWRKVTLNDWITLAQADTLQMLWLTNSRDTLAVGGSAAVPSTGTLSLSCLMNPKKKSKLIDALAQQ
jgi:hypothetical protein